MSVRVKRPSHAFVSNVKRLLAPGAQKRVFGFDDIRTDTDLYLISEAQAGVFCDEWEAYLSERQSNERYPNLALRPRYCFIKSRQSGTCELSIAVNLTDRWHSVIRTLTKGDVVGCVQWPGFEKRPYLIVTQRWAKELEEARFSTYALVDVIGTKSRNSKDGRVDGAALARFRARIDRIAKAARKFAFLSFADSVLVRHDWSVGRSARGLTYEPEVMLDLVVAIRSAICAELGASSYAIISQGANWVADESGKRRARQPNHAVFGSLGSPFAELFSIERAVKESLGGPVRKKVDLYLAASFAESLRYQALAMPDEFRKSVVRRDTACSAAEAVEYLPIDQAALLRALKLTSSLKI